MPTRLLREGILTSERVDRLDPPSEVFYRRLMSKVDDHGLYDARPSILRASLYPLKVDRVREADITRWIAACDKAELIALFAHNVEAGSSRWIAACEMAGLTALEKPYLMMLDTRWQVRAEAKHPLPPVNGRKQLFSSVHLDEGVVGVGVEGVGKPVAPSADALPAGGKVNGHRKNGVHKPLNDGAVVIAIPLVGNAEYDVHQGLVDEFEKLYPAVDVPQTLREIRAWNLTRPNQRKTATGILKHINTWLSKEQNKG